MRAGQALRAQERLRVTGDDRSCSDHAGQSLARSHRMAGGLRQDPGPEPRASAEKLLGLRFPERQQDLLTLKELIEAGKLTRSSTKT